ncbi:glycosyltransferase [Faecalispora jeddahensis]|uniref:glycosyltransferase n=1 Tax=Faecalispora jeddahensis TaxID=1414721 RepID=UPI0027BA3237|nr:glycosyltransferase [Faecalispora jeddahensis]
MTTNKPQVSIIIPVYNTERYINTCLDSLLNQTCKDLEIIVVNNGSGGNIDQLFQEYADSNPERNLKLVKNEQNLGTFHGRGSGMSVATGTYFTFMDADDRVDSSYFEAMVSKALRTQADIVVADMVHEDENGNAFRYLLDPTRSIDFEKDCVTDPFAFYYSFQGFSYSMYGIWNKIYHRDIWDRCKWLIDLVDEQFALCEDAAYTTIFFSKAKKIASVHDHYYYHYVHSDSASGGMLATLEKAERSIRYQGTAFRQIKKVLKAAALYDDYEDEFKAFRNFHCKVFLLHINQSQYDFLKKAELRKKCLNAFEEDGSIGVLTNQELIFTKNIVPQTKELEWLRDTILNNQTQVVSFDIFGTALLRDVWNPQDVFDYVGLVCKQILPPHVCFSKMRTASEEYARKKLTQAGGNFLEITFDEIYDAMQQLFELSQATAIQLKYIELECEKKFLKPRKITLDLFNLAMTQGKTVIFTSDMYYSGPQLRDFLQQCGYVGNYDIIASSDFRRTKGSGSLYLQLKRLYPLKRGLKYFHIGDDWHADVNMAISNGFDAFLMPKPTDLLCGVSDKYYSGEMFRRIFGNYLEPSCNDDLRLSLNLAANLAFDNPYVSFSKLSDFNGDPYLMGVICGGLFVNSVLKWILAQAERCNTKNVTFLGEDSGFIRDCFAETASAKNLGFNVCEKTSDAMNLYTVDDIKAFSTQIDPSKFTPNDIIQLLSPVLKETFVRNSDQELFRANFVGDERFPDNASLHVFISYVIKNAYDAEKVASQRQANLPVGSDTVYIMMGWNTQSPQYLGYQSDAKTVLRIFNDYTPWGKTLETFERTSLTDKQKILLRLFFDPSVQYDVGTGFVQAMFRKGAKAFLRAYHTSSAAVDGRWYEVEKKPMYYLLNQAKPWDCFIFNACDLPEYQTTGEVLWLMNVQKFGQASAHSGKVVPVKSLPWLARAHYLFRYDRAELKAMVNKDLSKHPLLVNIFRRCYRGARRIYHFFRKKI